VELPDGLLEIGMSAFHYCQALESVNIPASVKTLNDFAFFDCSGLSSIEIPGNISQFGSCVFYGCTGLKSALLSEGCSYIGYGTFQDCSNLETVDMPESVMFIGEHAFSGCSSLSAITLPKHMKSIEQETFSVCSSLASIVIPSSITSIKEAAFNGCTGLTMIRFNGMVPSGLDNMVFEGVNRFIPVYVPCESLDAYKSALSEFTDIKCIEEAEPVGEPIDEPVVEPSYTSVEITWPIAADADKYIINLMLGGKPFCTLTFDASGLLLNIEYANGEPSTRSAELRAAIPDATGYKFTIEGLTEGTEYTYTVDAVNALGSVIDEFEGSFTTLGDIPTEAAETSASDAVVTGIYDLAGQPVLASTPGLKIFTYSDGTAVKSY
jgi:hypothetical protein